MEIILAVPRKGFGSADFDTVYTIYLSLCTQSADLFEERLVDKKYLSCYGMLTS